jgi:hypothetical protein
MAAVTIALYLLSLLLPSSESVFAMKATNTYGSHSYVWNVFTAGFYNTNIIMVCCLTLNLRSCWMTLWLALTGADIFDNIHCDGALLI